MKAIILAAVAALALVGTAQAELTGTHLDMTVIHTGHAGVVTGPMSVGNHEFGTSFAYQNAPIFGQWSVTTNYDAPTDKHKLLLNFSQFTYIGFTGEVGTLVLENLGEAVVPDSIKVKSNNSSIGVNIVETHNGFAASWRVDDVLLDFSQQIEVTWNSVAPAPGAMALLGFAGLLGRGRRRRD